MQNQFWEGGDEAPRLVAPYATKGKYRRGLSIWTNERVVVAIDNRIFTTATLTIIKRCPEGIQLTNQFGGRIRDKMQIEIEYCDNLTC